MHASFLGHRIEKESTGYTAVLYLDPRLTEFAGESGEYEKEKNLREAAFQYLHEKFPELTIKSVKIMLGSLLLTSFSLAAPVQHAQAYHAAPGQTAHPQWVVHYRVQAGDSLWLIARRYETTINEIKRLNRLHTDWIYPGQVLHVPRNDEIMDLVKQLPDGIYTVGNRGGHVRFIQRAFHYLGYPLAADGIFGTETRSTVLTFQKQHAELANDGIFGPQTKKVLSRELLRDTIVPDPAYTLALVNKNHRLPSDYVPANLVVPNVPFSFEGYHPKKLMRKDAAEALTALFRQAERENLDLYAVSGYRSYERQDAIFTANAREKGIWEANRTSAKPGESEHQTGLAIDVTSPDAGFVLSRAFGNTQEGRWLREHAADYGFIIRYPEGKEPITGYQYEPWHLRYVGKDAARTIMKQNITLEEYLTKR